MPYVTLRSNTRFLKNIEKGAGRTLRDDEISSAEDYADTVIEGKLGKSWEITTAPKLIVRIADMLASSMAYDYLYSGQSPNESNYAKVLHDRAMGLLKMIENGELGLKLQDGTWDEDYPGAGNKEEKESESFEILA